MKVLQELLELIKELCIDLFTIQCLKHIHRSVGCQTGMSFPPHKYLSFRQIYWSRKFTLEWQRMTTYRVYHWIAVTVALILTQQLCEGVSFPQYHGMHLGYISSFLPTFQHRIVLLSYDRSSNKRKCYSDNHYVTCIVKHPYIYVLLLRMNINVQSIVISPNISTQAGYTSDWDRETYQKISSSLQGINTFELNVVCAQ